MSSVDSERLPLHMSLAGRVPQGENHAMAGCCSSLFTYSKRCCMLMFLPHITIDKTRSAHDHASPRGTKITPRAVGRAALFVVIWCALLAPPGANAQQREVQNGQNGTEQNEKVMLGRLLDKVGYVFAMSTRMDLENERDRIGMPTVDLSALGAMMVPGVLYNCSLCRERKGQ